MSPSLSSIPRIHPGFPALPILLWRLRLGFCIRLARASLLGDLLVWLGQGELEPAAVIVDKVGQWRGWEGLCELVQ